MFDCRPAVHRQLFSIVFVLAIASGVSACPNCKNAIAENGGNLIQGYFWSICFMMSMPFIILGSLSGYFYLQVLKARKDSASTFTVSVKAAEKTSV